MPRTPERRWLVRLVAYAAFVSVVGLATVPVYLGVEPRYRAVVVRLSAALIAAVLLRRALRTAKDHINTGASSALDEALHRPGPPVSLDPSFVELRDEVRFSTTSQRYFEQELWPRLAALRAESPAAEPRKPRGRRFLRRGPALAELAEVVATLERRR